MSNNRVGRTNTFRLAITKRKIAELFKNPTMKVVLLAEIRERGYDAAMITKMLDKIQPVKAAQLPGQQPVANANVNVVQSQHANGQQQPQPQPRT